MSMARVRRSSGKRKGYYKPPRADRMRRAADRRACAGPMTGAYWRPFGRSARTGANRSSNLRGSSMPNRALTSFCVICMTAIFATVASAGAVHPVDDDEDDLVPTGKGYGERKEINTPGKGHDKGEAGKAKPGTNISFHGGPVMLGTTNVYYIWYGNWGSNTAKTILGNL